MFINKVTYISLIFLPVHLRFIFVEVDECFDFEMVLFPTFFQTVAKIIPFCLSCDSSLSFHEKLTAQTRCKYEYI